MEIGDFIRTMERLAPPELAEEWDRERIGLVVEGTHQIERICCALDATPEVVGEAAGMGADMLVVHHTPLWDPVNALRGPLARLLRGVLEEDMNIYVMHTNFDHAPGGVNDVLAGLLGMEETASLSLGVIGECGLGVQEIADRLNSPLRTWGSPVLPGKLAIVGGSGFAPGIIEEAKEKGARSFLSAEIRHSVARASPIPLIEATHYALEAPAMRALSGRMGWTYVEDIPFLQTWTPRNSGQD